MNINNIFNEKNIQDIVDNFLLLINKINGLN